MKLNIQSGRERRGEEREEFKSAGEGESSDCVWERGESFE